MLPLFSCLLRTCRLLFTPAFGFSTFSLFTLPAFDGVALYFRLLSYATLLRTTFVSPAYLEAQIIVTQVWFRLPLLVTVRAFVQFTATHLAQCLLAASVAWLLVCWRHLRLALLIRLVLSLPRPPLHPFSLTISRLAILRLGMR